MRRVLTPNLSASPLLLPPAQAHHLRDVLRLEPGSTIELFDGRGNSAIGRLIASGDQLAIEIIEHKPASAAQSQFSIASAIPKGQRADWMVEKLSELGCSAMTPLLSERSVVTAEGQSKRSRWQRLAEESARQSGRTRVMSIEDPIKLRDLLKQLPADTLACFGTTQRDSQPLLDLLTQHRDKSWLILIGPEGGWTDAEHQQMRDAGLIGVSLGPTILRVETAALAAAALCSAAQAS